MNRALVRQIDATLEHGLGGAIATVIGVRGSVPQVVGARILRRGDGEIFGTIGGGAVEKIIIEKLEQHLDAGAAPDRIMIDLTKDLGMCCGGSMEFLIENLQEPERLILFGAGHVARPTAMIAREAGFSVVVVDDREELNTDVRFPNCERIVAEPVEADPRLQTRDSDYLVSVTHDHRLDEEAVRHYARRPHRYLGLIGSKRKVRMILQRVQQRGVEVPSERFYGPVGIAIGAETPAEIAVSIVAELISIRRAHAGAHLRLNQSDPALPEFISDSHVTA